MYIIRSKNGISSRLCRVYALYSPYEYYTPCELKRGALRVFSHPLQIKDLCSRSNLRSLTDKQACRLASLDYHGSAVHGIILQECMKSRLCRASLSCFLERRSLLCGKAFSLRCVKHDLAKSYALGRYLDKLLVCNKFNRLFK